MISNDKAIVLIERALSAGNKLRLHQNGFIQLDMVRVDQTDPEMRLHIWDKDIPPAQNPRSPIHNHTFSFRSEILCGELTHIEFEWIPAIKAKEEELVVGLYKGSGDYEHLEFTGEWGAVRETGRHYYDPGTEYTFDFGKYHDSLGKGFTATMMTKTLYHQIPYATVVCQPSIGAPDNTFRRDKYPQSALMPFVEALLERL